MRPTADPARNRGDLGSRSGSDGRRSKVGCHRAGYRVDRQRYGDGYVQDLADAGRRGGHSNESKYGPRYARGRQAMHRETRTRERHATFLNPHYRVPVVLLIGALNHALCA